MNKIIKIFIKLLCPALFALLVIQPVVSAEKMSVDFFMREINRMQGSWYDEDGQNVFVFNGATLNNFPIEGMYDAAGGSSDFGARLRILIDGRYKDFQVSFQGLTDNRNRYHTYFFVGKKVYRRTPEFRYYESIGGIYLGMPINKVFNLYGQPDIIQDRKFGYSKLGLVLDIRDNMVCQITIYPYGDRAFDRSGLSANNSPEEFARAYGLSRILGDYATNIGYYEFLWMKQYPKSVTLSLYGN